MSNKEQIKNWQNESKADLESAINYINRLRIIHGLFLCHLAIEKSLKAIIVKTNNKTALKSHDINLLANTANVSFTDKDNLFINSLVKYKIQGRYPDDSSDIPSKVKSEDYLKQTKLLVKKLHSLI